MNNRGFAVLAVLVILVAVIVGAGIAYVHWIALPQMSRTPSEASLGISSATTTENPSATSSKVAINTAATTPRVVSKSSSGTIVAAGAQDFDMTGWSSQSVVISQAPLVCYTIRYFPQLTPQNEDYRSPPVEYFADEAANHKSIANGLNGIEITPLASATVESVVQGNAWYAMGTAHVKDFSTTGGLKGKELIEPPIRGLTSQEGWTIYLGLSEAGNNYVLVISSGANAYSETIGEAMARSIQPSCGNH
jgi:hypothetical protein